MARQYDLDGGYCEVTVTAAMAARLNSLNAEIDAVTAEAARLRDTTVAFTTQQLRNDLARLADDVVHLARILVGRAAG